MLNYTIKDFVGVYENAFSSNYCEDVIRYYNAAELSGLTKTRMQDEGAPKKDKDNDILRLSDEEHIQITTSQQFVKFFKRWDFLNKNSIFGFATGD